jgi:hypothetical protein
MRRFGCQHRECYVWWGGYMVGDGVAQIERVIYPEIPTSFGRIHLGRAGVSALQAKLHELDLVLIAELHTHPPGAGGQNDVDAANPAATYPGFTSIVVPDFALPRFARLEDTYVYRYMSKGRWHELTQVEVGRLFNVHPGSGAGGIVAVHPRS